MNDHMRRILYGIHATYDEEEMSKKMYAYLADICNSKTGKSECKQLVYYDSLERNEKDPFRGLERLEGMDVTIINKDGPQPLATGELKRMVAGREEVKVDNPYVTPETYDKMCEKIEALEAQNKVLTEALEYYKNPNNWGLNSVNTGVEYSMSEQIAGHTAQLALHKVRELRKK